MMMPSIFGENLFDDDWMNFPFEQDFWGKKNPLYGKHAKNMMKTDVKETEKGYEVAVDLPGFKKDEIQLELNDGYLTISAEKGLDKEEKDKKDKYIRRERYAGSMSLTDLLYRGIYHFNPGKRTKSVWISGHRPEDLQTACFKTAQKKCILSMSDTVSLHGS